MGFGFRPPPVKPMGGANHLCTIVDRRTLSTGLLTTIFVLYCTPRSILEVIPIRIRELLDAARRSPRPLAPWCSRVTRRQHPFSKVNYMLSDFLCTDVYTSAVRSGYRSPGR